ncbi:uncharacterized protein [Argopecten irradians]|uniref:uncharacterized protein n=1 Tax=Argopecten irradians TaxID=31199 RepID=UPI00371B795D
MAAYGKLVEFCPESEVWIQYIERLEHYFTANDFTECEKKKAILLSVCGSKMYKLMSNSLALIKPGEQTFDEFKELNQNTHSEVNDGCFRCGKQHSPATSRYKDIECYSCGKTGHLQRQSGVTRCQTRRPFRKHTGRGRGKGRPTSSTNYVEAEEDEVYTMFHASHSKDAYMTTVQHENKSIVMEIDTGASLSVISQRTPDEIVDQGVEIKVQPCDRKLRTYLGEPIPVVGKCLVSVVCNSQSKNCP